VHGLTPYERLHHLAAQATSAGRASEPTPEPHAPEARAAAAEHARVAAERFRELEDLAGALAATFDSVHVRHSTREAA
jgi:hypothetical protein